MTPAQRLLSAEGVFEYHLGEEVRWNATSQIYQIIWRDFHEDLRHFRVLYGIRMANDTRVLVWEAEEADLEPVYTVREA